MIKDVQLAAAIHQQIREACRILDESARLVRDRAPESTVEYTTSVGWVFETVSSKLLDPLYKEHPEMVPAEWA